MGLLSTTVYRAAVKSYSSSTSEILDMPNRDAISQVTYGYIELADGTIIKKFITQGAVNDHFLAAYRHGQPIELHIGTSPIGKGKHVLLAIKNPDGRTFAPQPFPVPAWARFPMYFYGVLGIITVPLLGFGFLCLWVAREQSRTFTLATEMRLYIESLPNAICV